MASYHSVISRLRSEIATLQREDATLITKESEQTRKINNAQRSITQSKSQSIISNKLREIERASTEIHRIQQKRAGIASKIATKSKDLSTAQNKQNTEDERSRKKFEADQKKAIQKQARQAKELAERMKIASQRASEPPIQENSFDFFISHASEDKEEFVAKLADELIKLGATVFYDEYTLRVGDSLRRHIDAGLRNSRFGVVILSTAFFSKEWPARELDGLVALETSGRSRILPIWHKVTKDEVASYSPTLADKVALNTSLKTAMEIAAELNALL